MCCIPTCSLRPTLCHTVVYLSNQEKSLAETSPLSLECNFQHIVQEARHHIAQCMQLFAHCSANAHAKFATPQPTIRHQCGRTHDPMRCTRYLRRGCPTQHACQALCQLSETNPCTPTHTSTPLYKPARTLFRPVPNPTTPFPPAHTTCCSIPHVHAGHTSATVAEQQSAAIYQLCLNFTIQTMNCLSPACTPRAQSQMHAWSPV